MLGPCPPCPKTILLSCYCGRHPVRPKRCGSTGWSCGKICNRILACTLHTCELQCHDGTAGLFLSFSSNQSCSGECKDCSERVLQPCMCGKQVGEVPCYQPEWSCGEVCNKLFSCLHHFCQRVRILVV